MKLFKSKPKIYKIELVPVDVESIRIQIILNNSKQVFESIIYGYIKEYEYNSYYLNNIYNAQDIFNDIMRSEFPKFKDLSSNLDNLFNKNNIDKIIIMEKKSHIVNKKVKVEIK
jgi:hypothetical protein